MQEKSLIQPERQIAAAGTWLVMVRATHAIATQLEANLKRCGLSSTDFRILEALMSKGPLPVNVIGPKVNLTPGSISVAVDRLFKRGLVRREQNPQDHRIRSVKLTRAGEKVIVPVFRQHTALLQRILEPLSEVEQASLGRMLKVIGKHAELLNDPLADKCV